MENWLKEVVLEGKNVRLELLQKAHKEGLTAAASDGELWNLWFTTVPSPEKTEAYIAKALDEFAAGRSLPFAVIDTKSGKIIGSSRFLNADRENKRLEIGATWYAKSSQRTGANTECKLLLLGHAFEKLGCAAVEFRTHWHNQASREAILRLGAKQDGVLRHHRLGPNGTFRDTVVFSILQQEWPTVKQGLEFKMMR